MYQRIPVHLAGGGEAEDRPIGEGTVEKCAGAGATHGQDFQRHGHEVVRRRGAGEIEHGIEPTRESRMRGPFLRDVVFDQGEGLVVGEVGDVLTSAGAQIVDGHHLVATGEQRVGHVGTDEARTTSQQHPHVSGRFPDARSRPFAIGSGREGCGHRPRLATWSRRSRRSDRSI